MPDMSMISQPTREIRVLYDLKAKMSDGVKLSADVFLPKGAPGGSGQYPTILLRTPYESLLEMHIEWAVWWAKRGYAVVIQDCRGRFESEGTFAPYVNDGLDGHETLAWISRQGWYNGKIGTSGRSYGGIFQWQLAPYRSPYLTAMAPQVIMGDYFKDCHRPGGAVQWALTVMGSVIFSTNVSLVQRGATHIFGNSRFFRHLPLIDADVAAIGRPVPFYRDWLEHTTYDDYWRAINTEEKLDQVDVPVYQQAGWYDPYTEPMFRAWNGMRQKGYSAQARKNQKIYVVPWTHHIPESSRLGDLDFGPSAYVDLKDEDLRWFDYWLKGIDTGIMDEPPIRIFVMGDNAWRFEQEWPLARTVFTPYYLHSHGKANSMFGDGTLTRDAPGAEAEDRFDYDPANPVPTVGGNNSTWTWMKFAEEPVRPGPIDQRPLERRDDVLVYTGPALEQDMEITGPLQAILYAATSARDTDFTVKLVDVYPEGQAIHLAEGILRGRYRQGFEREDLLQPGEVAEYRIELASTSNVFKKGHRLRVEISSSNFPRFDRNLNTGEGIATGTRMQVAHQTVLHNSAYPSHIVLPVIPR
ncbi:MAG: CocE/NonD family hydrolase [Chloroflexi bacterium]|nr:CocE/NonD family hydrolase [Chloroflexota bacterium]